MDNPERIWAQVSIRNPDNGTYSVKPINDRPNVAYIRADLHRPAPAQDAIMVDRPEIVDECFRGDYSKLYESAPAQDADEVARQVLWDELQDLIQQNKDKLLSHSAFAIARDRIHRKISALSSSPATEGE